MTASIGAEHERWADASGAYLLGALPPEEAGAYAAHLDVCPACRAEVDHLEPAAAILPTSVIPMPAPAALRDRVMAEVRREASLLAAAGEGADRVRAPRRRARDTWLRWRLPALAVAGVLIGLAVALSTVGGGPKSVDMAATGPARGAHVRLVVEGNAATIEAEHLPAPSRGRVYQVWLKPPGGDPRPTQSLFVPRSDGTATVAVPGTKGMEAVLVTAEPGGGSNAPTSPPVLSAEMS
jgi:hypothetical protein